MHKIIILRGEEVVTERIVHQPPDAKTLEELCPEGCYADVCRVDYTPQDFFDIQQFIEVEVV